MSLFKNRHLYRSVLFAGLSLLFFAAVTCFWALVHPEALSYREQYQLFQLTGAYLAGDVSRAGGVADYIGEFLTQFFLFPWAGALIVALVLTAVALVLWRLCGRDMETVLSPIVFVPSLLCIALAGDESVLMSYPVALLLTLLCALCFSGRRMWWDILVIPLLYWCSGPLAWLYVLVRLADNGKRHGIAAAWGIVYLPACQLLLHRFLLTQWPLEAVMKGLNYTMVPAHYPALLWIIPVVVLAVLLLARLLKGRKVLSAMVMAVVLCLAGYMGVTGFDADRTALIRQDYLVRNERWDDIINDARKYQVMTPFSSVCVNLALSQKRQLAEQMFAFYQSGKDALIMPRVRDLTSMLPSAEAFWRLGMVNAAQRYMFDTQESILNGRRSGRCTKRIAECMIVNGHYQAAAKQIEQLKPSLFYRRWALEAERLLGNEGAIAAHPVYGRLRKLRYKENYLYSYEEIDKMFGLLYINNNDNRMALDYFMGELLLKGELQGFMQYLPMALQQGGYQAMPWGYQDAVNCIQKSGAVQGSPYREYVRRQTGQ